MVRLICRFRSRGSSGVQESMRASGFGDEGRQTLLLAGPLSAKFVCEENGQKKPDDRDAGVLYMFEIANQNGHSDSLSSINLYI